MFHINEELVRDTELREQARGRDPQRQASLPVLKNLGGSNVNGLRTGRRGDRSMRYQARPGGSQQGRNTQTSSPASTAQSAGVSSLFKATPGREDKRAGRCRCRTRPAGQRTEQKAQGWFQLFIYHYHDMFNMLTNNL